MTIEEAKRIAVDGVYVQPLGGDGTMPVTRHASSGAKEGFYWGYRDGEVAKLDGYMVFNEWEVVRD